MKYFSSLPYVVQLQNGNIKNVLLNLVTRVSLDPQYSQNPLLYYAYTIQEGDTPEIIAQKYYNDSYRYWIILAVNNLFDAQWDWPLNYIQFSAYIADKYQDFDPTETIHHYEKNFTYYDQTTQTTTVTTVIIDENTFNSTPSSTVNTYTLPTGKVTVTTTTSSVSYYDYEVGINEAKRNINLLDKRFVDDFEKDFLSLI
jgi:Base plate wedge protein 53